MLMLRCCLSCSVQSDTICGIFAQENQYKVLKTHHIHKANMDSYCSRYVQQQFAPNTPVMHCLLCMSKSLYAAAAQRPPV